MPHVIPDDVKKRAVDLGEAGQRLFLDWGHDVLESLEVLLLDQLGNRHHLAAFDELRRRTCKGVECADEFAALLRLEQIERGLGLVELAAGRLEAEPCGPVDLGEGRGARR